MPSDTKEVCAYEMSISLAVSNNKYVMLKCKHMSLKFSISTKRNPDILSLNDTKQNIFSDELLL